MENGRSRAIPRLGALALAAACLAVAVPGGRADDPSTLRDTARGLAASEQEAVLRLYAAESATARAGERLARLERRARALDAQVRDGRHLQAVATASLSASRARVASALRTLYVEGSPPDAFAVILGAGSLEDAIDGIDSLRFAAAQNRRLAEVAARRATELRAASVRLQARAAALRETRDAARAAVRSLQLVAADRARTLASVRDRLRLTERRLEAAEQSAREAARRSAAVQAERDRAAAAARVAATATPAPGDEDGAGAATVVEETPAGSSPSRSAPPEAPPAPVAPVTAADGTTTLEVRSTAYSLTGRTASGLPTGPGIIAVDPSVIPLGTRVYVPGYGEAVAADTGSAVQGAFIDVWLPSRADALAWGMRIVTITIYRS